MEPSELTRLEASLNYHFNDPGLLFQSLRHSSYVNEADSVALENNERLEFLGDAVLNLVIGHILIERYPELNEGDLSQMRATLVNESQLAKLSRTIDIGTFVMLGKGELQSNGQEKSSILADTLEAVIAAVYLDGGFESAFRFIAGLFSHCIESIHASAFSQDAKSRLQEYVQSFQQKTPVYNVVRESGPDHDKTFVVRLQIDGIEAQGSGKSKKAAEQAAARKALEILQAGTWPDPL